jgi:aminoglycoside phosphotransferase (APT) family kinase protein
MTEEKLAEYKNKLTTDFPNLQINSVKFIGSGWHYDAIEVNGNIVFRIPRFDHASDNTDESVGYETAILKLLRGKLKVAIPNPLYVAKDKSYFGYPKLGGELLADKWQALSEDEKDKIIKQWVDIVIDIHKTVDLKMAQELHVPLFSDPTEPLNKAAYKIHEVKGLDPVVYKFANKVLALNDTVGANPMQNTLIHNDLHLFNMLIDPDTHELTGVIDWTDVCIGPLEREFCCWEWEKGDTLVKTVELYQEMTRNKVSLEQARFWKHIETITDIVEAAESNDQKKIDESVDIIKYWVANE